MRNFYVYTGNDPVDFRDPYGESRYDEDPRKCADDLASRWSIAGLLPGAPGLQGTPWSSFINGLLGNNVTNFTSIYDAIIGQNGPWNAFGTILGTGAGVGLVPGKAPGVQPIVGQIPVIGKLLSFAFAPKWFLDALIYLEAYNYCVTGKL
jgi:hypothetical protein